MAAAAAAARKPAHAQGQQQGKDPLPQWIVDARYTTVPNVVIERLMRCLTYTEFGIILILLRETVGGTGRPEWARLPENKLADTKGVSSTEISESLISLEFRKKLIESQGAGKAKKYRIIPERLEHAEERKPRTLEKKSEPRLVGRIEKFTLDAGQPARAEFEEPASEIELVAAKDSPAFSVERSMLGSVPRFVIGLQADAVTPVMVSAPLSKGQSKVQPITGVTVSPPKSTREAELRELLTPIFLNLFHRKPDDILLHQVERELKGAAVEHYGRVVHKRVQAGDASRIKSGLFVMLARETAEASAEIERRRRPMQPPAPAPVLFVPEPEHSNSPWAKIRRELAQHIAPQEYQNWLVRTHHAKLDAAHNKLTVLVPDAVTIEFIEQEYSHLLPRCAAKAGFGILKIVFKVAEENS